MEIASLFDKNFIAAQQDESVKSIIGKLKKNGQRTALIFDGRKFLGVVTKKSLLRSKLPDEASIAMAIKPIKTISPEMDVLEAAFLMYKIDASLLPVEKNKEIIGVLTVFHLINQLKNYEQAKRLKVREIKFDKVKPVTENDRIGKVIHIMRSTHSYVVPVIKNYKLTGVISVSDLIDKYYISSVQREARFNVSKAHPGTKAFEGEKPAMEALPVKSFDTSSHILTTAPDKKIIALTNEMIEHNTMSAVIIKDEKPIGICTANNLIRVLAYIYQTPTFNIQYVGIRKAIDISMKTRIEHLCSRESVQISREINNDFDLIVHIKNYKGTGRRKKYSIHLKIEYPGQIITADGHDWDAETALRRAFQALHQEIKSKFKLQDSWDKPHH